MTFRSVTSTGHHSEFPGWRWAEVELFAHVQLEPPVEVEVGPEQGGQAAPVGVGEFLLPFRLGHDELHHAGVEVDDRGLDQVQGQRGDLHVLFVVTGQVAGLAVEDVLVR